MKDRLLYVQSGPIETLNNFPGPYAISINRYKKYIVIGVVPTTTKKTVSTNGTNWSTGGGPPKKIPKPVSTKGTNWSRTGGPPQNSWY